MKFPPLFHFSIIFLSLVASHVNFFAAPPPPPVLTTGSNKLVINKSGASAPKPGQGDLIGQLQSAVKNTGFLKKTDISEKELEKRGVGVATKLRKTVVEEVRPYFCVSHVSLFDLFLFM